MKKSEIACVQIFICKGFRKWFSPRKKQTNQDSNTLTLNSKGSSVQYFNSNYLCPSPPATFIFCSGGGFLWKLIKPGSPSACDPRKTNLLAFFCSSSQKSEKYSPWGICVLRQLDSFWSELLLSPSPPKKENIPLQPNCKTKLASDDSQKPLIANLKTSHFTV